MRKALARLSLRSRLMIVGLVALAGALALAGVLLYASMSAALVRSIDDGARDSALEVATLVETDQVPDPIPVTGSHLVQVLDEDNTVVAVSATADRLTPLVTPDEQSRVAEGTAIEVPGSRAAQPGELRVVAREVITPDERLLVVVGAPTSELEASSRLLRTLLLIGSPVVLIILGLVAWQVIGAALRPVETLRRSADRIGQSTDDERLPVPAAEDEIRALATTLNGMLDRLAAARSTQRAFVADAAHELRSPLASMRTQLEVAQRLGDGGRLPDDLLPEVARLSTLVEDLLVLARADDARSPRHLVDLNELLDDVSRRYVDARVPVRVTSAVNATVRGAPDGLFRAVTNLVDNAVRHASSGVDVELTRGDTDVELTIRDDGPGIPAAERERMFDRFARLDDARDSDSGGSGLGLAIARALVRRADGDIHLEDAEPGVRAVVTLPLGSDDVDSGDDGPLG